MRSRDSLRQDFIYHALPGSMEWRPASPPEDDEQAIRENLQSWDDLAHMHAQGEGAEFYRIKQWLAGETKLPIVVKGIMTGEDARRSAESGAKAVIVSNHGTRYLDTTFTTIEVLPEVVEQVDGKAEVYMDGGVRRGARRLANCKVPEMNRVEGAAENTGLHG